jgi:hypothetical protein
MSAGMVAWVALGVGPSSAGLPVAWVASGLSLSVTPSVTLRVWQLRWVV